MWQVDSSKLSQLQLRSSARLGAEEEQQQIAAALPRGILLQSSGWFCTPGVLEMTVINRHALIGPASVLHRFLCTGLCSRISTLSSVQTCQRMQHFMAWARSPCLAASCCRVTGASSHFIIETFLQLYLTPTCMAHTHSSCKSTQVRVMITRQLVSAGDSNYAECCSRCTVARVWPQQLCSAACMITQLVARPGCLHCLQMDLHTVSSC